MSGYQLHPLADALYEDADTVDLEPDNEYQITGVYSFGRGLIRRPIIRGEETAYERMTRLRMGQIVMSKLNAWEGALAVVEKSFGDTYVSPEYPVFSINTSNAHPRYIKHLIIWPTLWDLLTPRGSMVRRKRTTAATLLATKVPLPSIDEQRRIADKLDAALRRLNGISALRSRASRLQRDLHESLINSALSSADPVRLGDIMTLTRTEIRVSPEKLYRAIGMRSFGNGIIHYPPTRGDELSKLRYFTFPQGALALSNIKAWEGAIDVTREIEAGHVASNRFLFYLPIDGRVNVSYLRHYFLSRPGLAQISANSPGGADRNRTLSSKRFENIELPLPSRHVQDRVAHTLDTVNAGLRSHKEPSLPALRPALLNAAFSGRL